MIVCRLCTFPSSRGGGWRVVPAAGAPVAAGAGAGAACCSCTAVAPRLAACWVPITQPRMMPKHMPAMAKTMESDLIGLGLKAHSSLEPILAQRRLEPFDERPDEIGVTRKEHGAVRRYFRDARLTRPRGVFGKLADRPRGVRVVA